MTKPYEIHDDPDFALVTWPRRVVQSPDETAVEELRALVRESKPVVFDFAATYALGTRWLRLVHTLSVEADDMAKELLVVGLSDVLTEKADVIAIRDDLHTFATLEDARAR